jgi:hypothetical protein
MSSFATPVLVFVVWSLRQSLSRQSQSRRRNIT